MKVKISEGEVFTDFCKIVNIENAATDCNALDGFHVQYSVEIRGKVFTVIFQSSERSNGLEAYNGYEVEPGAIFGCDADEYFALESFIISLENTTSEEEGLLSMLQAQATLLSKAELNGSLPIEKEATQNES